MPNTDYSSNYITYNSQTTKNIVIAVEIEGLSTILSTTPLNKRIRYGDPGLTYGEPGIVYGGLSDYGDYKTLIDINNSSLTIQQKIEPEQGRGSVSLISLSFVDLNGYMSQLISPGVILDEILGKQIKVYLGFQQLSFPEDYTIIFRGRISQVQSMAGSVEIQISDPNVIRRQQIHFCAKTKLLSDIDNVVTTVPAVSVTDFFQQVLGPASTYDSAITTYIKIDNEYISYPATGIDSSTQSFVGVTRGQRGTTAAPHTAGADIDACIQIEDDAIAMALKTMLSGWQGPYISDIPIQAFVITGDPIVGNQTRGIVLPVSKDANINYGISPGDYVSVSGAINPGNDGPARIVAMLSTQEANNQVLVTDKDFIQEGGSPALISIRSQYDTYPDECGLKMPATEVDVEQHQFIKNTFLGSNENRYRFFVTKPETSGKTWLESEIYLPISSYSLTRFGRMSMQLTHAPIADQRLQFLTGDNVIDPQSIAPLRGINSRKFFNQIQWRYDFSDAGKEGKIINALDTESNSVIGVASLLPIPSEGLRSDITPQTTIDRRTHYLLSRYKNGAVILSMSTNFGVGTFIEAGDVIAVQDNGVLKISNFTNGQRNLGSQLFEVIDRSFDLTTGQTSLQLVSGLGAAVTDRYATFSPATILLTGSNQTKLVLGDSFDTAVPGQEYLKWLNYLGLRGIIHTTDWTSAATCVLSSLDSTNPNIINVTGLSIPASAGMILDVDYYPDNRDPHDQELIKLIHCSFDPQVVATSGISDTQFVVASSGIGRFQLNLPVLVHNSNFSVISTEQNVTNIDTITNVITVAGPLGFTPSAGNLVDLIGFADGGASYRFIG